MSAGNDGTETGGLASLLATVASAVLDCCACCSLSSLWMNGEELVTREAPNGEGEAKLDEGMRLEATLGVLGCDDDGWEPMARAPVDDSE